MSAYRSSVCSLKKRGKLERVSSYGLALVLLVFWIAVYGLSCLNLDYRAAHFLYTQPDTTWTTESGCRGR